MQKQIGPNRPSKAQYTSQRPLPTILWGEAKTRKHEAIKRHIATDSRLHDNKDPQRRVPDVGVSYVSSAQ